MGVKTRSDVFSIESFSSPFFLVPSGAYRGNARQFLNFIFEVPVSQNDTREKDGKSEQPCRTNRRLVGTSWEALSTRDD